MNELQLLALATGEDEDDIRDKIKTTMTDAEMQRQREELRQRLESINSIKGETHILQTFKTTSPKEYGMNLTKHKSRKR